MKFLLEIIEWKYKELERKLEDSLMFCDFLEVENKSYKDIIVKFKENIFKFE